MNILQTFITIWFSTQLTAKGDIPGTYYWRPRLGIDLTIPKKDVALRDSDYKPPNEDTIRSGKVVLIDSYGMGMVLIAIASGISASRSMATLNIGKPEFYTNAWRWFLRYISQLSIWASGKKRENFCSTTQVWPRRFYYMDEFVPKWIRSSLFYIKPSAWDKEFEEYRKFKKYSESAFGRSFRFPSKKFDNWTSEIVPESQDSSHLGGVSNSQSEGVFKFQKK